MLSAREVALHGIYAVEKQDTWANAYLKKAIAKEKLDSRDAALATHLLLGVLQNKLLLDAYIGKFSTMKVQKMESKVRDNLRLALYQLLFSEKIPANAAVNEAVNLTKKYCKNPRAPGMVNGILRAVVRTQQDLPSLDSKDPVENLSLRYSHPRFLVQLFLDRLGPKGCEALLQWNNTQAPTSIQMNALKASTQELRASLEAEQVVLSPHPWLEGCFLLSETGNIEKLSAFKEGLFYVQDPAAKLAVLAAGVKPFDRVLDACAAPGGKSFGAAILMENKGELLACDIYPHKKALIEAGRDRLGLTCIEAKVQDAAIHVPQFEGSFDVIIADVPCSGLGVIRKKPDIRYKNPDSMKALPKIQLDILKNLSTYLKPGGTLLYATCTLRREENEEIVAQFLRENSNYTLWPFTLPQPFGDIASGQITLWPQDHDTDGFFIAKLRRNA